MHCLLDPLFCPFCKEGGNVNGHSVLPISCKIWIAYVGAHLEVVYDDHGYAWDIFYSSSAQRHRTATHHSTLHEPLRLGWQLEEHLCHPLSTSLCASNVCAHEQADLREYYDLTTEAKCLRVARTCRLFSPPYLLITPDGLLLLPFKLC